MNVLPGDSRSLAILDILPIGVFVIAPDGRQLYANAAVADILGRTIEPGTTAADRASFFRAYISGTDDSYPPTLLPSMRALSGARGRVLDMESRAPGRTVGIDTADSPIVGSAGKL